MPVLDGWIGPERIAMDHYDQVRLVVRGGVAHVAAVAVDGIFYVTNEGGLWTTKRVTRAPADGYDGQPSIAFDQGGALGIAFTRFGGLECSFGCEPVRSQGIFLSTNRLGSWSDSVPIIDGRAQEPSLQATNDGVVGFRLAYSRGDEDNRSIEYASEGLGKWTTVEVGEGSAPSLRMDRRGLARITYDVPGRGGLYYAAQAESGEFVTERVPGDWVVSTPLLALGPTDEPQIVFFNDVDQFDPGCGALSIRRTAEIWSDASVVFPDDALCQVRAETVDTDSAGTLHVVTRYDVSGPGVWYANDVGGAFQAWQLREPMNTIDDRPGGGSAMAIDDLGRPHVIYDVSEFDFENPDQPDEDGLWYRIGPSALPILQ